jgi:hypothetical protein
MAVVTISGSAFAFLPFNSHIPGAKVCGPVNLFVNGPNTYVVDLSPTVAAARVAIQSVYIDASQLFSGQVTLTCGVTNQTVSLLAGQQGYFPITVSGNSVFTVVTSNGSAGVLTTPQLVLFFFTVPFVSGVWQASNQASCDQPTGGTIQFPASTTSQNLQLASFVNQYLITSYTVTLTPTAVPTPIQVRAVLLLNGSVVDSDNWVLGQEPRRNPPMKASGLNMLFQVPQHTNGALVLFVTTSAAVPVVLTFWHSFLGRPL